MRSVLSVIPALTAVVAAIWGIYSFNKQQKFKRLENLSLIFQRFADKDDFIDLFTMCDEAFLGNGRYEETHLSALKKAPAKLKLKYLALLEEVALYASYSEVDKKYAVHLFQWHFYYIFNDATLADAFWFNLGGGDEKTKSYWEYQKQFARYCKPVRNN